MAERIAFANLGAEEGPLARGPATDAIDRLARHFEAMVHEPPWPGLATAEGVVAWMNTEEAQLEAARRSVPLWGAPVAVVHLVHDKGFAMDAAARSGLLDDDVAATVSVLAAEQLEAAGIEALIARWPSWARPDATLKPRWGTSGRGRVAVKGGVLDARARNGLAALRKRGGAVLEPWLDRVLDLSSQWLVRPDGDPELLGCTRMITRRSGVWLGCEVHTDKDGRGSGTGWDPQMIAAARPVVAAAAAAGYRGVCGVDAFVWQRDGVERLRGVVELNARFTGGAVALAFLSGTWGRASLRISD